MKPNQFDIVRARLTPLRTDDIKPEALPWIGREFTWLCHGEVDFGDYDGDMYMAVYPPYPEGFEFPFVWSPLCDLTILEQPCAS